MTAVPTAMRALLLLIPACASSARPAAPVTAPAAPATAATTEATMAALQFYAGTWKCETTEYEAGNKKPGPPALVHVLRVLNGNWYEVEMTIAPTAESPLGWRTHEFKGFDPATKKWVMVAILAEPGAWVTFGSDGLIDNKMIWTPSKPETPATRGVMTRISDTEYDHVEEQAGANGFQPTWSKHCRKESDV